MPGSAATLLDSATLPSDAPRGAASVALLCQLAAERGVEPARCLRGTGVDLATLADPEAEVTAAQELRAIANLLAAVDEPEGLGLEAGRRYRLTTYGIWGFAVLSSRTARDANTVANQFLDLTYALTRISDREVGGTLELFFDDWDLAEPVRRFVLERDSAAALAIWREMLEEPVVPLRVELRLPQPERAERFVDAYDVVPTFEAARSRMAFDAALLDRPLPRAAPLTAELCARQCRDLLERRQLRRGISGRVRAELLRDPRRIPGQDEVAAALHVSVRTLRRHLVEEGTTFRQLVEQTREVLAEELLATGRLTVEQVADRVGYASASSFVHAFTRWKGMPPRRWAHAPEREKSTA
jgi:AraC-like DNA-binding protein